MASRRGRSHPHRGHKGPHPGARGKPHPHKGSHVPHPGARGPHPRHESPAQAAAARASLTKARAAHPKGQQTSAQLAAERSNLVKARAARKAKGLHTARKASQRGPTARRARTTAHRARPATHRHAVTHRSVTHRKAAHTTATRRMAIHKRASIPVKPKHYGGHTGITRHHYNRHGLEKAAHRIAGHRRPIRPRRRRYVWTVPAGRRHGWNWTKQRKPRNQW
ncbi:hypothetical protein LQ327_08955 [Actinomycetospora endophytica]|uniref:NUMOD3 motif-containing protein n=1 Tax=Actinomycetospora endophytica TaxID=2291215 RepID=A0ABS8P5H0_9PSEU|nr:hypothetical protein [Actinomycetospora endophytica]MCD2193510.1 hypothetical protein [Actinomycetospora endophytica]